MTEISPASYIDFPARGEATRLPGLRILAFIAPVEPGGGGTVVAAGTHHLVERLVENGEVPGGHSAAVRDLLAARHPWLRALWAGDEAKSDRASRFLLPECIDGFEVRVKELTGAPGDVVLMHPWTFHAPATNCGSNPRLMVSHSVYRHNVLTSGSEIN